MIDPHQALQQMLQPAGLPLTLFPPTSRYHGIETATLETLEGKMVIYLKRRFVPPSDRFTLLQEHVVVQGDRWIISPRAIWEIPSNSGGCAMPTMPCVPTS